MTFPHSMIYQIQPLIQSSIQRKGNCHVMLTGGRSAASLYAAWATSSPNPADWQGLHFYFGDERCVPPDHIESNYGMVIRKLFPTGVPQGAVMHRMEADASDQDVAADRYAALLPETIDILLLSVGEDGHIASLFPQSASLHEYAKKVIQITGPKAPYQRLTITPNVIKRARYVFVMAISEQKRAVYEKVLQDPGHIDSLPARLVLKRNWIFGD